MNFTLSVTKKEGASMSGLIKQMCLLNCRIKVDSLNGKIIVADIAYDNVGSVVDAIDEAFDIANIDISPKPIINEDSIEFEKLEFNDEEVREQANRLLKKSFWAMYISKAKSRDICQYLMSAGKEIAMKYNPKEPVNVSVGNIVDCNFGSHLKGEISGGHIHSIVCDIDDDELVYVVPITKYSFENDETKYLRFLAGRDVEYMDSRFTGGTVLLKMGRYVNRQRFNEVVGQVLPEFFGKVLTGLSNTANFVSKIESYGTEYAEKIGDVDNDDDMLSFGDAEESSVAENPSKEEASKTSPVIGVGNSVINYEERMPAEDYLTLVVADALASLDKTKPIEETVDEFLDAIGMPKEEIIIRNAFIVACKADKIAYRNIALKLQDMFPKMREEIIVLTMKEEFNKWLAAHPDVKDRYPRISIMVLLKIFARNME